MKTKTSTPTALKKLFIVAIVTAWAAQAIQLVALAATQYATNPNLSGFVSWAITSIAVPLLLVALIYLTRRNKTLSKQTIFEVLLVAIASMAFYSILALLYMFLPVSFPTDNSVLYYQLLTGGIPLLIVAGIFLFVLLKLRARGEW